MIRLPTAAACALLVGALSAPVAALAAPITVDFTITSVADPKWPHYAGGVIGTGHFTFDDSLIPASGTGHVGNSIMGAPTLDIAFDWFGTSFDMGNAGIAVLTFAGGALKDWWIGGTAVSGGCSPLMRFSCISSAGTVADFQIIASGTGSMNDGVNAGIGWGRVDQWDVRAPVPEPGTMVLSGAGLLALGLLRRGRGRSES